MIKLNKPQRRELFNCHVGVGLLALKTAPNEIVQIELFTDRDGTLRKLGDALCLPAVFPIEIRPEDDEEGPTEVQPYRRSVPPEVVEAVKGEIVRLAKLDFETDYRSQERTVAKRTQSRLRQWLDDVKVESTEEVIDVL